MSNKVYGIDLGTTYSCISTVDEFGRPTVIANADSQSTTPSVVWFASPESTVVGIQAKRNARIHPDNVVSLVKRHMGDSIWRVTVHDTEYSAPAISSLILKSLVADASAAAGEQVTDVVITVPAYFGDEERKATKLAGELAGLNVIDIINEPTAAAIAYGFAAEGSANETVLVYDLGGGTFDSTVIRLADKSIEVIATDGDHELGGADWDERLATYLSEQFVEQCPDAGDPLDDSYGAQDVITTAEETKQSLSMRDSVDTMVVFGGGRASITVTRDQYEALTADRLERTIELTKKVLEAAAVKGVTTMDRVLLVGGMSKSPAVARRLKEEFGFDGQLSDPDLSVAKGAAMYGQKKELENFVFNNLVNEGKLDESQTLDDASAADVEAAVAATAAEFGLSTAAVGDLVSTSVANVTSRGFGIEVFDGSGQIVSFLAHAQDTLPIQVEETFSTVSDNQTVVNIRVYEQATAVESAKVEDNKCVVEGDIVGIPSGYPARTPVTIVFSMGKDQTIEVTAKHQAVAQPLVLKVDAGVASDSMRAAEQAKVDLLKPKE